MVRRALRYQAETWHEDRGRAPEVCGHIFEVTPSKGQMSSKGQIAIEMPNDHQNKVGRTPD